MSDSAAHRKLVQLQKRLFLSLRKEADRLLGEVPDSIQKYEKEYRADFNLRKHFGKPVGKSELLKAIEKADVIFIADFHTFTQAQKTALRFIREAVEQIDSRWAIGLELIPSHYQEILDEYQAGKLNTETFLRAIRYSEAWGFPWSNYAPIFEWARQNHIPLIALDRPKELFSVADSEELHQRDRWAAGRIIQTFEETAPPFKFFVLYGELHIGSQHLPRQLNEVSRDSNGRRLKWVTIHQNEDRLYWKLAMQNRELQTDALQLRKNIFCVFSGTPWAKLQSLVTWAEGGEPENAQLEGPDHHAVDYLSLIRTYGNTLSEFLKVPSPCYEALNVVSIENAGWIQNLSRKDGLVREEVQFIQFHLAHHLRLLIPKHGIAYLATPSYNGAAEIAATHLLYSLRHSSKESSARGTQDSIPILQLQNSEDFYRLVLDTAFGFFGSLVLNPRRKCDLPVDHQRRIRQLGSGGAPALPQEREARVLTLEILRNGFKDPDLLRSSLESRFSRLANRPCKRPGKTQNNSKIQWPALLLASRFTGRILGKMLHLEILAGKLEFPLIHQIFLNIRQHWTPDPPLAQDLPKRKMAPGNPYQNDFHLLLKNLPSLNSWNSGSSKQDRW